MLKILLAIIICVPSLAGCDKERDHFLECVQTRGKRPCEPMSMKYDENKHECGCNTKHRGWIKWNIE